jgi:hypothetical protein
MPILQLDLTGGIEVCLVSLRTSTKVEVNVAA